MNNNLDNKLEIETLKKQQKLEIETLKKQHKLDFDKLKKNYFNQIKILNERQNILSNFNINELFKVKNQLNFYSID